MENAKIIKLLVSRGVMFLLNCDSAELKRSSKLLFFFCFRAASLGGFGLILIEYCISNFKGGIFSRLVFHASLIHYTLKIYAGAGAGEMENGGRRSLSSGRLRFKGLLKSVLISKGQMTFGFVVMNWIFIALFFRRNNYTTQLRGLFFAKLLVLNFLS